MCTAGFCVFNDQAVAAAVAMRDYGQAAWPILVVDLDVHQVRSGVRSGVRPGVRPGPPVPSCASKAARSPSKLPRRPAPPRARGAQRGGQPSHPPLESPSGRAPPRQGNGTAAIFETEPRVVTFSMHHASGYPWSSKTTSTHDVDLPDGTDDEAYLAILADWLPRLFEQHAPKLVFFQAGVDALEEDALGRLSMSRAGMMTRNPAVFSACQERGVPLVTVMGGGYSRPSDASLAAHTDVFRSCAYRFARRGGR